MDQFFEICEKYYKPVAKGAGVVLGIVAFYTVEQTLSAISKISGGLASFLYVMLWIAFIVLLACGIFVLVKKFAGSSAAQNSNYSAPANNQQSAAGTSAQFCTKCGATVPAGQQFCNNCGNKIG